MCSTQAPYTIWMQDSPKTKRHPILVIDKRVFGHFQCHECENEWDSGYALITCFNYAHCPNCNKSALPQKVVNLNDPKLKKVKITRKKQKLSGAKKNFTGYTEQVIGDFECSQCFHKWEKKNYWILVHWRQFCMRCNNLVRPKYWEPLAKPKIKPIQGTQSQHKANFCEKCKYSSGCTTEVNLNYDEKDTK